LPPAVVTVAMQMLLEMMGHKVRLAHTRPAGVEAARLWQPDVVLCDLELPGLDGFGVAGRLRQEPGGRRLRLIALSGYGQDEDRKRAQEAGFEVHLTKPVDPDELSRVLLEQRASGFNEPPG
jgi:CheY-like chemotaxis protein